VHLVFVSSEHLGLKTKKAIRKSFNTERILVFVEAKASRDQDKEGDTKIIPNQAHLSIREGAVYESSSRDNDKKGSTKSI